MKVVQRLRPAVRKQLYGSKFASPNWNDLHAETACHLAGRSTRGNFPAAPVELLDAWALFNESRFAKAAETCERLMGRDMPASASYLLARSYFELAQAGRDEFIYPACLSAVDALERGLVTAPDVRHATAIIRWCLDCFSDTHRISTRGDDDAALRRGVVFVERELDEGREAKAVTLLHAVTGLVPTVGRSAESMRNEALFLLAQAAARTDGRFALDKLHESRAPLSGPHDLQPYREFLYTAAVAGERRLRARNRGVPCFLATCLPKSASEYLCYTAAGALDAPVQRVSVGRPFSMHVSHAWVREALRGGCVTHDHYAATPTNLAELAKGGADKQVVLARDPRAAAWSLMKMQESWIPDARLRDVAWIRQAELPQGLKDDEQEFLRAVQEMSSWISSWLHARSAPRGLRVHMVTFGELTRDPAATVRRILAFFDAGAHEEAVVRAFESASRDKPSSNFRAGDDAQWRRHVSPQTQSHAWACIPGEVRQFLELTQ